MIKDNPIYNLDSDRWNIVFREHANKFGFNNQLTVLIEECGELTKALCKIIRNIENDRKDKKTQIYNLHEETIDCLIMETQFKIMYLKKDWIENIYNEFLYKDMEYVINNVELILLEWLGKLINVSTRIKLKWYGINEYEFSKSILYVLFFLDVLIDNKLDRNKIKDIMIEKYVRACERVGLKP